MIEKIPFGRMGHHSTRILFGAAALAGVSQEEADRILEILLRHGINHIDVAASYGEAELRVGPWMKRYRSGFFLATKTGERSREKAAAEIGRSLERLQTDHLDLIQLHAVTEPGELEATLGEGGALEAAVQARAEGLVRFIGITSHSLSAPDILMRALERFEFTSVLLPYNYPMMRIPQYAEGFRKLLGICQARGVAVQTIKSICRRPWKEGADRFATTWYEPLTGPKEIEQAVGYVLGQAGIFLNTVGDVKLLPLVLDAADRYSVPISDDAMQRMAAEQEMSPLWTAAEISH